MPDYLAPGVYVEELPLRPRVIEGVGTSSAGFIGPCRFGPVSGAPVIIASLAEYERLYGDGGQLAFGSGDATRRVNYLWNAARSFFGEGGKRLYVSRVFRALSTAPGLGSAHDDGHGRASAGTAPHVFRVVARHPGAMGNLQVRFTVRLGPNLIPTLAGLGAGDVVWVSAAGRPRTVRRFADLPVYIAAQGDDGSWRFSGSGADLSVEGASAICALTLDVEALTAGGRVLGAWQGLPLRPDGVFELFGMDREAPIVLLNGSSAGIDVLDHGIDLLQALAVLPEGLNLKITRAEREAAGRNDLAALGRKLERGLQATVRLTGGNDGVLPAAGDYEGQPDPAPAQATGLKQFETIDDIAIVAAPGATDPAAINKLLITHAEQMRYRIALLDPPGGLSVADVRVFRSGLDSSRAALYYPWVTVKDPASDQSLNLPPSGFVAGIFARNDVERAVFKAPANEVVRTAIGFETGINAAEQEVLNPEGINCLRSFAGRGHRLWGARTLSSDPAWKYVNLRRYFAYLEHSIDKGTQWVVFEPHGEALWVQMRAAVSDFLFREWRRGGLLGDKPENAFFVRCDRSTMTQSDLDNGRLVCLIGVAPLKPAEFVILRIGQWTADRRA
ncbi:MAG: phage tail sheath family protein [Roseateles sp.]|uniref:phage tail sheath family protein n=1 Tax=Roseateles sp. TaxID=1971397 RepID=UPI0040366199